MKNNIITILLFLCVILSSCKPNYGSLTGNVFWKFNNYVGNKPDAGSEVSLFPYKKNSKAITTKADVQGNFKFEKLEVGEYLLIVASENTTSSQDDRFNEFRFNKESLKEVFDFDLEKVLPEKQKEFMLKDSLYRNYIINRKADFDNFSKQLEVEEKKRDTIRILTKEINDAIPSDFVMKLGANAIVSHKLKIKKIKIEKENVTTEIIDFGITYF